MKAMSKDLFVRLLISVMMAAGFPAGAGFVLAQAETPPAAQAVLPENVMLLDALEIRDMDINDVFKLISEKSGLNIIAGKTVQGRVTIFLKNVDVRDALTMILKANDLAFVQQGDLLQVVTAAEYEQMFGRKFGVKVVTRMFSLRSLKARDAAELLEQVKSAGGKIIPDGQSNALMVEDVPEKITAMAQFLELADAPTDTRVYKLEYTAADGVAEKLKDKVTPKIGSVSFDAQTNKLFVTDTLARLKEMDLFVKQVDLPRDTRVFDISYARAEDLVSSITPLLSRDIGHMQVDKRSNSLIVTDSAPKIKQIEAVVAALDKNEKEVLIEAKIIQITLTDSNKLGFDWQSILSKYHHTNIRSTFVSPDLMAIGAGSNNTVNIGTIGQSDFAVVIDAIAHMSKSRILSSPRIAAINNQEAQILIGDTTPYVVSTTTTTASGNTIADTVNFIDTGVKLVVTPTVHDDGFVTMKIKPEVSNSPRDVTVSNGKTIPAVNTSKVDTTVRVKDGVTVVIGGLIKDTAKEDQYKVPVLGGIPVLGRLFRSEGKGREKSEIIIFLTPHIMTGDVQQEKDAYIPDTDTRSGSLIRKY